MSQKKYVYFFGGKTAGNVSDLNKAEKAYKKIQDESEKAIVAELKRYKDLEKAFDDYQKTIDKKAQAEQKSAEKAIRES